MLRFQSFKQRQLVRIDPFNEIFALRKKKNALHAVYNRWESNCAGEMGYEAKFETMTKPICNTYKSVESIKFKKPKMNVIKKLKKIRMQRMNLVTQQIQEFDGDMFPSSYFDDAASRLNYFESLIEGDTLTVGDLQSNSYLDYLKTREKLLIEETKEIMVRYELVKMEFNATGFMDVSWCFQEKQQEIMNEMEKELYLVKSNINLLCNSKSNLNVVTSLEKLPKQQMQKSLKDKLFDLVKSLSKYEAYSNETPRFYISKAISWNLLKELYESNNKLQCAIFELTKLKSKCKVNPIKKRLESDVNIVIGLIPQVLNGTLTHLDDRFKTLSFRIEFLQLIFNTGYVNNEERTSLTDKACMILDCAFEIMKEQISKHKSSNLICDIALFNPPNIPKCEDCIFCECLDKCLSLSTTRLPRVESIFSSETSDGIDKIIANEIYEENELWQNFDRQEAEVVKLALDKLMFEDIESDCAEN